MSVAMTRTHDRTMGARPVRIGRQSANCRHSNARAAFSEAAARALQIFANCALVSEESRVY
jgi:hypothetical protein